MSDCKETVTISLERYESLRNLELAFHEQWKYITMDYTGTTYHCSKNAESDLVQQLVKENERLTKELEEKIQPPKKSSWF